MWDMIDFILDLGKYDYRKRRMYRKSGIVDLAFGFLYLLIIFIAAFVTCVKMEIIDMEVLYGEIIDIILPVIFCVFGVATVFLLIKAIKLWNRDKFIKSKKYYSPDRILEYLKNNEEKDFEHKVNDYNNMLKSMTYVLEKIFVRRDLNKIIEINEMILEKVKMEPEKEKQCIEYINYFIPSVLKVLIKYDELENQHSTKDVIVQRMKKFENSLSKIELECEKILENLYSDVFIDGEKEIQVLIEILKVDNWIELTNLKK